MPQVVKNVSGLEHPQLQWLYKYWLDRRGDDGFVPRESISIADFPHLLRRIALAEVIGEPPRFYWRVVGDFWRELTGFEGSRTFVDQYPFEEHRRAVTVSYTAVMNTNQPHRVVRTVVLDEKILNFEALLLPLSKNAEKVSMILTCIAPTAKSDWIP